MKLLVSALVRLTFCKLDKQCRCEPLESQPSASTKTFVDRPSLYVKLTIIIQEDVRIRYPLDEQIGDVEQVLRPS